MSGKSSNIVVHIARTPQTGVWSFIKNLATWQSQNSPALTAVRIIADRTWPLRYYRELEQLPLDKEKKNLPFFGCGTINYCSHILRNPVSTWVNQFIQEYKPNSIVVHFHNAWLSGSYLPISEINIPIKTVVTFHGIADIDKLRKKKLRKRIHSGFARRLVKYKAHLVSVDKAGARNASELFGIPASKFTIIHNGLAVNTSRQTKHKLEKTKAEKPFQVGFVSSLFPEKGWQIVAEAVLKIAEKSNNIRLLIAGEGPDTEKVNKWVQTNKKFAEYRGFVSNPVEQLMKDLDVLVLPSINEGLPMVILEALSCSVPVLATPVGGIPDVINDGINGFLIERKVAPIVMKLEFLMQNRPVHLKMRKNALRSFQANFTMDRCGMEYEKIYSSP